MKKELKQLAIAGKVALLILWPASAWAATITFGEQLASMSLLSVLVTVILSTVVGVGAMLQAMVDLYEKNHGDDKYRIPHLWLFVSSRMAGANIAGLVTFFMIDSCAWDAGYKAAVISVFAFGGNWSIQRLLQFFANKYVPEGQR